MYQVLRESPCSFGGVQKVAHNISLVARMPLFYLSDKIDFSVHLPYSADRIPSFSIGKLYIPLFSSKLFHILFANTPLLGHLPSPEILLLLLAAKIINNNRRVAVFWHSFLHYDPQRPITFLYKVYEQIALRSLQLFDAVITTSPPLAKCLSAKPYISSEKITILPLSLESSSELHLLNIPSRCISESITIVYIGRLDTYKRLDLLIPLLSTLTIPWHLCIVGDGPNRPQFQDIAINFNVQSQINFMGFINEFSKLKILQKADIMILPSFTCNEAFGLAQLEAMASGIPSLAFQYAKSGAYWVSNIPQSSWNGKLSELNDFLKKYYSNQVFRDFLSQQSRQRYLKLFSSHLFKLRLLNLLSILSASKHQSHS